MSSSHNCMYIYWNRDGKQASPGEMIIHFFFLIRSTRTSVMLLLLLLPEPLVPDEDWRRLDTGQVTRFWQIVLFLFGQRPPAHFFFFFPAIHPITKFILGNSSTVYVCRIFWCRRNKMQNNKTKEKFSIEPTKREEIGL